MAARGKFTKQLLVDGIDDLHVILALCNRHDVVQNFDVIDCKGIANIEAELETRLKQSNINTLGIIVDADAELKDRWESISNFLGKKGFEVPESPSEIGLITTHMDGIKAGVWIMQNNKLNGMLEDFIKFLVPPEDQLMPVVDSTLLHLEEKDLGRYKSVHKSKAAIHTWLAWQEDPGTPMGLSITKRYLTTEPEVCNVFIEWLKNLFAED
jgi:hypothetical protein